MDGGDARVLGPPPPPLNADHLTTVAGEQRGLVTRAQCRSAGMSIKAIEVRLSRGSWVRSHRGVYLTVPGRDDWWTMATAAHLACGPGAAWSHETAAFVWGLTARPGPLVDVMVGDATRVSAPKGVRLHRSLHVDRRCDPMVWPWRTDVEETLLDLADMGDEDALFALLGRAFQRHLTGEATLLARLAERPRHRHRRLITASLADVTSGAESAMELRYARDVERAHGLPVGERQRPELSPAAALRLRDVAYVPQRVLVELDGRLGHEQAADRVIDGRRDLDGAVSGWLTVRAFWPDVAGAPCRLAADVGTVLGTRGWEGRPRRCRRASCVVGR